MKEDKTWTWENMLEMAQRVTKDTDVDGEIDQWGISSINPIDLIYSNGGEVTRSEGDTIKVAFDSPQAVEALQFYQDLYQKYNVVGGDLETFKAGKSLFHSDRLDICSDLVPEMGYNFRVTWYPLGPKGKEYRNLVKETDLYVLPFFRKLCNLVINSINEELI